MKTYKKIVHEGNLNKWHSPKADGTTITVDEHHAKDLNAQFPNTGVLYEPIEAEKVEETEEEKQFKAEATAVKKAAAENLKKEKAEATAAKKAAK